jgi:hypothetical protein
VGERRVTLDLQFPDQARLAGKVSVHVVVEDVGEADAAAPLLYETEVHELSIGPDGKIEPIELRIPDVGGAIEPAIRVHVDQGATGTLTEGDFINPARLRLPDGKAAHCDVPLVEIR